jgi:protein O-mannosyl-transferase
VTATLPLIRPVPRWVAPVTLVLLALAAGGTGLVGGFVGDDTHVIVLNSRVHPLLPPWEYLRQSYWPPSYGGGLYRPLAILWFAVQWSLGGGAPALFHAVSLGLYVAATLVVWRLALAVLPAQFAWIAAALFAVHPVHVEAVANVVGQSELLVEILLGLATLWYLQARRAATVGWPATAGLVGVYILACLTKETGLVLPGLLLMAELILVSYRGSWRDRAQVVAPLYVLLAAAGVGFLACRAAVLGGLVGETAHIAIRNLGFGARLLTMLGVVPEWVRLLGFPWHLQADYMPLELDRATGFGTAQAIGTGLLFVLGVAAWRGRHLCPACSFGIAWIAVTIFPVSNLAVPTGIMLAERTLFSPSAGACLALGGLAGLLAGHLTTPGRRTLAVVGCGIVLAMGAWRSATRTLVWHDDERLIRQTVIDAPLSYHAHALLGRVLFDLGDAREGEREFQTALRLYPHDPEVFAGLGQRYRNAGLYPPAIPLFRQALRLAPQMVPVRNMLIYCLLQTGDSLGVERELAEKSVRGDPDTPAIRALVDSAFRAGQARRSRVP